MRGEEESMQGISNGENPIRETMAELRLSFERRISNLRERSTGASASFSRCLHSSRAIADDYLSSLGPFSFSLSNSLSIPPVLPCSLYFFKLVGIKYFYVAHLVKTMFL
jgi:hypothetical protein